MAQEIVYTLITEWVKIDNGMTRRYTLYRENKLIVLTTDKRIVDTIVEQGRLWA